MKRSRAALVAFLCSLGLGLHSIAGPPTQPGIAADFGPAPSPAHDGLDLAACGAGPCGYVLGFYADGQSRVSDATVAGIPARRDVPLTRGDPSATPTIPAAWRYWYDHPLCRPEATRQASASDAGGPGTLVIGNLSRLAADPRHSTGNEMALRLNEANDGLDDPVIVWPEPRVARAAAVEGPAPPSYSYGCDVDCYLFRQTHSTARGGTEQPSAASQAHGVGAAAPTAPRTQAESVADEWLRHEYECQFGCEYQPHYSARPVPPTAATSPRADWLASEETTAGGHDLAEGIVREDIVASRRAGAAVRSNLASAAVALRCLGELLWCAAAELNRLAKTQPHGQPRVEPPQAEQEQDTETQQSAVGPAYVPWPDAYLGL